MTDAVTVAVGVGIQTIADLENNVELQFVLEIGCVIVFSYRVHKLLAFVRVPSALGVVLAGDVKGVVENLAAGVIGKEL